MPTLRVTSALDRPSAYVRERKYAKRSRSPGTRWWITDRSSTSSTASGTARASRMHSSVSSQPSGRFPASRPMPVANPPAISNASLRKEALPPRTLRTRTVCGPPGPSSPGNSPRYAQPTTQSNSSGNQDGRRPEAHTGSVRPPTASTRGSA